MKSGGKRVVGVSSSGGKGTDWTADQVGVVVANYFLVLEHERRGDKIVKAELYNRLAPEVGRSAKSIEWKLRNVSAVFEELGIAWISGLLPAHNYQDALVHAVGTQLRTKSSTDESDRRSAAFFRTREAVLVDPPPFSNSSPDSRPEALRRLVSKYDPAERDEFNRSRMRRRLRDHLRCGEGGRVVHGGRRAGPYVGTNQMRVV